MKRKLGDMLRLALIAALLLATWFGNNWIQVTRYRVELGTEDGREPRLGTELANVRTAGTSESSPPAPGLRILQISDLHGKRFGLRGRRLLRRVDELDYDIVAISGDFITGGIVPRGLGASLSLAAELAERAPVYYVAGNHEATSSQFESLAQGLRDLGVVVLRRDAVDLELRGCTYTILGLDDYRFFEEEATAAVGLRRRHAVSEAAKVAYAGALGDLAGKVPADRPRILISHRPDILELYTEAGLDLVLAGHVHGGQFRIPGVGGLLAPDQGLFPHFDAGVFRRRGTTMVISRGLGPSVIPVRIFNRPELVLIEVSAP